MKKQILNGIYAPSAIGEWITLISVYVNKRHKPKIAPHAICTEPNGTKSLLRGPLKLKDKIKPLDAIKAYLNFQMSLVLYLFFMNLCKINEKKCDV